MARMVESEREVLRARHRVRPLEDAEEGYGIQRLDGVYGFTYSPGPREFPLFKTGRPHTFEVHKLAAGAVVLIGFASEDAASLVESGKAPAGIRLFPAPHLGARFPAESAAALRPVPGDRPTQSSARRARPSP